MNIKLQQLQYFLIVVEEGGFRAASHKANRTQAALSTSIKELEKSLGSPLFEPGNKCSLTPFAKSCLPQIRHFLANYDVLREDLTAAASGHEGKVRIASVPSLAAKMIPNVLGEFCVKFPNVEVNLIDDNAAGVESRLLSGEVDLAIGNISHSSDSGIMFTPLVSDPIGVVCKKTNPIARYQSGVRWQELQGEPFIRNGTCSLLEGTPARVLISNALYSVENITSLFSVLELDLGVTTLPQLAFPARETSLIWIKLVDPELERQVGVFSLAKKTISPQAKAFHDLCVQYFAGNRSAE
ncbi:transcriptional regulator LysR family [Vibrio ponticus]|nr:transcriptional regulator LysR family [Vibrio ponticus]